MTETRRVTAATRSGARGGGLLHTAVCGAALSLFAAGVVGCGGDDQGGKERAATARAGQAVDVAGREYSFDPNALTVEGGDAVGEVSVQLALRNRGGLAHNLTVVQGEREVAGTRTIVGGRSESVRLSLKPGDYRLVCTVDGHAEKGMVGTLQVR